MIKKIYDKKEFLEKISMDNEMLDRSIRTQILKPAGKVDGSNPYFDDSSIDAAEAIGKLLEIGYSMEEVIRIRRKVGLPGKTSASGKEDKLLLTVGELANRIGSNPRTIKHWEEKGIIEPDSHSPGGFRLYYEGYVKICALLQDLQNFGYTLDEIKIIADLVRDFLAVKNDPAVFPPARVREKLELTSEQIALLNEKMLAMERGIKRWRKMLKQHQKEMSAVSTQLEKRTHKSKKAAKPGPATEPSPA